MHILTIIMIILTVLTVAAGLGTCAYYYTAPVGWRPTPKPVPPPVTPALPACGHTMATPVMHDEPPSPELILVAFWCPDCETQLPASFIPPPPGGGATEEDRLREAASLLTEADGRMQALAKRNKELEAVFDKSHAPGGPWDQLAHARKLLRQQREEIIDLRKGSSVRWRCGCCGDVVVSNTGEHAAQHHGAREVEFRRVN